MDYPYMDEILSQLLGDTFSVFCGAGATADVTGKQWQSIFSEQTRLYYEDKLSDDIYFLADLEKSYYGNQDCFPEAVADRLRISNNVQSRHIDAITDLTINQIWTTNFDSVIEQTIQRKYGFEPTVIKESKDIFLNGLSGRYLVYKLNGSVDVPSTMILTKKDFYDYSKKQRLLFELLKRQLVLDTFLFIGYSFKDDLVLNALREIKDVFPQKGKCHYRFFIEKTDRIKDGEPEEQFLQRQERRKAYENYERLYYEDFYHIKTICIQSYDEIDKYLSELYKRYCNRNVFISGSFRHISPEQRIYIEKVVDQLVQTLFAEKYNIYSGNGRGLGEMVVARSDKYQQKYGGKFVNRPLIFTGDSAQEKREKNELIMKDCNTMIVICGQSEHDEVSRNVVSQCEQFLQRESSNTMPLVIPIPSTGNAAEYLYKSELFTSTAIFRNNKEVFQKLSVNSDPKEIARIVVNLILSYRAEPNS